MAAQEFCCENAQLIFQEKLNQFARSSKNGSASTMPKRLLPDEILDTSKRLMLVMPWCENIPWQLFCNQYITQNFDLVVLDWFLCSGSFAATISHQKKSFVYKTLCRGCLRTLKVADFAKYHCITERQLRNQIKKYCTSTPGQIIRNAKLFAETAQIIQREKIVIHKQRSFSPLSELHLEDSFSKRIRHQLGVSYTDFRKRADGSNWVDLFFQRVRVTQQMKGGCMDI